MLRLLRKSLANHNEQFLKILYFCVGAHLILLLFACFVTRDDALHISLNVAPHARVVCVPSFMVSPRVSPHKKSARKNAKQILPAKKIKSVPAKKDIRKAPTALTAASQKILDKNKTKKTVPKKNIKKTEELETKVIEQKKVKEEEVPKVQEKEITEADVIPDDVIYVNKDTYHLLEIAQQLQEAIGQRWSPPAGMVSGLVCQVRVTIDVQGKATALEVVEKSGVAVFDMAARKALLESDYPNSVWGKTIVVDFNEEFL